MHVSHWTAQAVSVAKAKLESLGLAPVLVFPWYTSPPDEQRVLVWPTWDRTARHSLVMWNYSGSQSPAIVRIAVDRHMDPLPEGVPDADGLPFINRIHRGSSYAPTELECTVMPFELPSAIAWVISRVVAIDQKQRPLRPHEWIRGSGYYRWSEAAVRENAVRGNGDRLMAALTEDEEPSVAASYDRNMGIVFDE